MEKVVASGKHCVTVFEDGNCANIVGLFMNEGSFSCTNVGMGSSSFRCSSSDTCDGA